MKFKIFLLVIFVLSIISGCNLTSEASYDELNKVVLDYEEKYADIIENKSYYFSQSVPKYESNNLTIIIDEDSDDSNNLKVSASGGPVEPTDEELLIIAIESMRYELESTPVNELKKDMLDNYIERIKVYENKHK